MPFPVHFILSKVSQVSVGALSISHYRQEFLSFIVSTFKKIAIEQFVLRDIFCLAILIPPHAHERFTARKLNRG